MQQLVGKYGVVMSQQQQIDTALRRCSIGMYVSVSHNVAIEIQYFEEIKDLLVDWQMVASGRVSEST